MCLAAQEMGKNDYNHHIFDSFEGLSEPTNIDLETRHGSKKWKKGDLAASIEETQKNLNIFQNIFYYKGWIPDRFSEVANLQFALVHIDVDLYQPTYDCLEFFYERMVPGGIILCDDYGSSKCPGAKKAFDKFVSDKIELTVIHLPTGQGFIIKS